MFSDHRRGAKLAIALSLLIMGFSVSNIKGEGVRPSLVACLLSPEAYRGRRIWIPGARVERIAADRFEISAGKSRAWVEGSIPGLKENDFIGLVATFDRTFDRWTVFKLDGDSRWRRLGGAGGAMGRLTEQVGATRLMYGVSALVLLWILRLFFREFRGRLAVPAFIARDRQ